MFFMDSLYVVVPALALATGVVVAWLAVHSVVAHANMARRIILTLVALPVTALAAICTYNAVAVRLFLAANPPSGKMYQVGGHRMHLYCIGSGQPTIVLEPGLGPATDVLSWSSLQAKLATIARVCSYDRAGLGWSEPKEGRRDADQVAADLHALLDQGGVSRPLLLVGASYGGIYIRDYTAHFPEEVTGLVFLDSSTPWQEERFRALARDAGESHEARRMALLHALYLLGIARWRGWCGRPVPGLDARAGKALGEDACIAHYEGVREFLSMTESSAEVGRTGSFDALPVLIFSHDPGPQPWADRETLWNTMQEELKKLSTRSRRIIARRSGHAVHVDREDLVVREVGVFVEQVRRRTTAEPANCGLTTVE